MKKIIFFNILITLALFPYVMARWIQLPYNDSILETIMVFGTFVMGSGLTISNLLMLLSLKWTKHQLFYLKVSMIFLAFLFIYPVYVGVLLGYEGASIWVDILTLGLLYGNLWLCNKEYQKRSSQP